KKIRDHTLDKVPFIVIAGERDKTAGTVSFRYRNGNQVNDVPIEKAIAEIKQAIAERKQV
ncbi:MAG: His/Gly/Thr/Pro-type tRNA ligase C-terminal domain-containing protein, partial [Aquiluna sp.]